MEARSPFETENEFVNLMCIQEGTKVRVRIISPGYLSHANCQISRSIRVPGRHLQVPKEDVSLVMKGAKWFYSVKGSRIEIVDAPCTEDNTTIVDKVYECANDGICIICMVELRSMVCAPCGHAYACQECSSQLDTLRKNSCCICRAIVDCYVPLDLIS